MKNQKYIVTQKIVDSVYNDFINNEKIFGISSLYKKYNLGSKSGNKVRAAIYALYGEENIKQIAIKRLNIYRRSKVNEKYRPSAETLKKRSDAIKRSYVDNPKLKELRRKNAYNTIVGRVQTDIEKEKRANSLRGKKRNEETRRRMSIAKKGKPLTDAHKNALKVPKSTYVIYKRTDETKKKLSIITKQQWKDGIHKSTYRSKGQIEVENIIKSLKYKVEPEFLIEGRPYDTFIPSKNLLIEFNGTFWHRDPRFYKNDPVVKLIHERDAEKIILAKKHGYDIIVIWQYDWDNCEDKTKYIQNILKNYGK